MPKVCTICSAPTRAVWGQVIKKVVKGQVVKGQKACYYYCARCGFIAIDPGNIPTPEQEKGRYLQHKNSPDDTGYIDMLDTFIDTAVTPFQRVGPRGAAALDFGCGPGPVLADLLEKRGYRVDVYDPYFAPDPAYRDKTYELITCTEVVEHLRAPMDTLALLRNNLTPDGIIALTTRFHPITTNGGEDVFARWWYRRDPTHICFFNADTFRVMADKLNMTVALIRQPGTITLKNL